MTEILVPPSMNRRTFVAAAAVIGAMANAAGNALAAGAAKLRSIGTPTSTFGKSPDDQALHDAWKTFCRQLEAAGDKVFKGYNPAQPLMRADGYRFLTQNLGQAFDLAYETKDTKYP